MNNKDLIQSGLLELYALGQCSDKDTVMVEEALMNDETVRREFDAICNVLERIASDNAVPLPADEKKKLIAAVDESERMAVEPIPEEEVAEPVVVRKRETRPRPVIKLPKADLSSLSPWLWAAMVLFLFLIGSIVMNYVHYQRWQKAEENIALLNQEKMLLTDDNGTLQYRYDSLSAVYQFMKDKDLQVAELKPKAGYDGNKAIIFWNRSDKTIRLIPYLKPLEAGLQYQLWAISEGKPVDAGLLPAAPGQSIIYMKPVTNSTAFAITIEKAGGSQTPALDKMVVFAQL